MRRHSLLLAAGLVALIGRRATSQDPTQRPNALCSGSDADSLRGTIRGRVTDGATNASIHMGMALLSRNVDTDCAVSLLNGEFVFRGVVPGSYQLRVQSLSYGRSTPTPVSVEPGRSASVEISILRENKIRDCLAMPACTAILQRSPLPPIRGDSNALREVVLRTSAAIVATDWEPGTIYVCIEEHNPGILRALLETIPKSITDGCELGEASHEEDRQLQYHGEKAVAISAGRATQMGDSAFAELRYFVGPLWAQGWSCFFIRRGGQWKPVSCTMAWIS